MKSCVRILITLMVCISVFAGCKRTTVIADGELREIFKEIYLANSYMEQSRGGRINFKINLDSLDIYRPLLAAHGYSVDDLRYTINNFSKRKSTRLSDVVEQAITELEEEEAWYSYQIAAEDSIGSRARRMFRRSVFTDSLITASKISDTSNLRLIIPTEPGTYDVSYYYFLDSLDKNRNLKSTFAIIDSNGNTANTVTNWLRTMSRQKQSASLTARDIDTAILIIFGNYPEKDMKKPDLKIDSLEIFYTPPLEVALDSVGYLLFRYKLHFDEPQPEEQTTDSLTLDLHPEGISEQRDSNS